MYVCATYVCLVPEARRVCQIHLNWSYGLFGAAMWLFGAIHEYQVLLIAEDLSSPCLQMFINTWIFRGLGIHIEPLSHSSLFTASLWFPGCHLWNMGIVFLHYTTDWRSKREPIISLLKTNSFFFSWLHFLYKRLYSFPSIDWNISHTHLSSSHLSWLVTKCIFPTVIFQHDASLFCVLIYHFTSFSQWNLAVYSFIPGILQLSECHLISSLPPSVSLIYTLSLSPHLSLSLTSVSVYSQFC